MITTHILADDLEAIAKRLREKPAAGITKMHLYAFSYEKEECANLVRAFAPLKKEIDTYDVRFDRDDFASLSIGLSIPRSKVCRKIQDEVWECEPIFSPAEEAALSQGE